MGDYNIIVAKFRIKDRNDQLKKFFHEIFDEDIDDLDSDHPWVASWKEINRLGWSFALWMDKNLIQCACDTSTATKHSLTIIEPDVFDIEINYGGKAIRGEFEEFLAFFSKFMVPEQHHLHIASYSPEASLGYAYVFDKGEIYRLGPLGSYDYNRDFATGVMIPNSGHNWGDPLTKYHIDKIPETTEGGYWSDYSNWQERDVYIDVRERCNVVSGILKWENVYSFRAEFPQDVQVFHEACTAKNIGFSAKIHHDKVIPDVVVELTTSATMDTLLDILREIPDSHVMLQTLQSGTINETTNVRDYNRT